MRILNTLIILAFCCLGSLGAQTIWTGNVDSDWTNPSNWSAGVPASGMTATIPGTPSGGNNPTYSGSPVINFTIQNAGSISFDDFVYNNGTIINFSGGTFITNNNYFVNAGSVIFDNDGNFTNSGVFENFGTFDNAASATFTNNVGGSLINRGTFKNNGLVANNGNLTNYGNFRSTNNIQNNGTINNFGFLENPFGSILNNNAGATIQNEAGGEFTANGTFENNSTINNAGDFMIQTACNLINASVINNSGYFESGGTLSNNLTYNNTGTTFINDAGTLENNANFQNDGTLEISICGKLIQQSATNITGNVINDGLIFPLTGTVNVTGGEFGETLNDLNDRKPPVPGCKSGFVLMLDENGQGTLQVADVDKGGYGQCGAVLVNKSVAPSEFTLADLGTQIVDLTVEDNFGYTAVCDAFISVVEYVAPVVPIDDPDLELVCTDDINVVLEPGEISALVTFDAPALPATTCSPGADCSGISNDIPGYDFVGELNGSKYYVAHSATSWTTAQHNALAQGGYLAAISDAEENDFLKDNVNYNTWIGLTDQNHEGTFAWVSNENVGYTNWNSNEPNDWGSGEDYTELLNNGKWNDLPNTYHRRGVLEIPCGLPTCTQLASTISGFIYMGEYNDSKYYCSSNSHYTWLEARAIAEANAGQLVIVDDAQENEYLRSNILANYAWIGLTDEANEGTFKWVNGEVATFFNWNPGEPNNNGGNEHYVRLLKNNGKWTDRNEWFEAEFVMEIPCTNEPPSTGNGEVILEQVLGPESGGEFFVGTTEVGFRATDDCGNEEICIFNVTVVATPSVITLDCPVSLVLDAAPGANSTEVSWTEPTATTTCTEDGVALERVDSSPENGGQFPVGQSFVVYSAIDSCGAFSNCSFSVTVNPVAAELTLETCPSDFDATSNIISWDLPTASTTCYTGNISVTQIDGPAIGSTVGQGTYQVVYLLADECGNTEVCFFNVNVTTSCAAAGTPCDDGDACTTNDVEDGICGCAGTYADSDADGICDADDICPLGDDNADVDGDGTPDACDDCNGNLVGTSCDDGDACTTGDVYDANCNCAGTFQDSDSDGVCDANDVCAGGDDNVDTDGDGTPDFCDNCDNSLAGTACDDGDACTTGDVYDANCNCAGTFQDSDNDGVCDADDVCAGNDDNADEDGDGTPDACDDCNGNLAGTTCDDGDACTTGDVYDANCNCAGTFADADNDGVCDADDICPLGDDNADIDGDGTPDACDDCDSNLVGTACDDGDACTTGDIYDANCNCAGTFQDSDSDGICDADDICAGSDDNADEDGDGTPNGCDDCNGNLAGTSCDDGDAMTENDVFDANCNCAGTVPTDDCDNVRSIRAASSTHDNCGDWCGDYAYTLGVDNCYTAGTDLMFKEFNNGTATLSGTLNRNGQAATLTVNLSGFTYDAPADSPKYGLCVTSGGDNWYYYTSFSGSVTYADGSTVSITPRGPAFQVGVGANLQDPGVLGASGWFLTSDGIEGDINVRLSAPIACETEGIYLEAECATVGGNFHTVASGDASNGDYVTISSGYNAYSTASELSADRVRFELNIAEAGDYKVFARVLAPSGNDDSFWVRANGGTWVRWNSIHNSSSFIWDQVHDNNNSNALVTFHLNAGSNIIDFAYREDGTLLDKIYVTLNGEAPTGLGEDASNCEDATTECIGEAGMIWLEQADAHQWTTVNLDSDYSNPVVVAYLMTKNSSAPAMVRVRNVTSNSFEVQIDEWEYQNGAHPMEDIGYVVVEAGTHVLSDGRVIQAGTTHSDGSYGHVAYNGDFNSAPIVVSQIVTTNDSRAAITRIKSITHAGFTMKIQGEEAIEVTGSRHASESVSWIAMEAGSGSTEGTQYEAGKSPDAVRHYSYWYDFNTSFSTAPVLVGGMQTTDGGNTAAARFAGLSGTGVDMIVEEERSYDDEVNHTHEVVGYLAFEEGSICATNGTLREVAPGDRLNFFAKRTNRQVRLYWVTNTEFKNDHFVIERSFDGVNFEVIEELRSITTDEGLFEYTKKDEHPKTGENFYRIKQVYGNGDYTYSNERKVIFDIDLNDVVVFPNPTSDEVYVNLKDFEGESAYIRIFDQFGRELESREVVEIDAAPVRFNVSEYRAGTYTMYVELEGTKNIARNFIVTRL